MKSRLTKRFLAAVGFLLLASASFGQVCIGNVTGAGSIKGAGSICPNQNPITSINISPPASTTSQGFTVGFSANANFADGTQQDVTAFVAWASSDITIATVGTSAIPRPISCTNTGNGTVNITATFGAITGTATLTCLPVPIITTASLPSGTVNVAYSASLNAAGGVPPYTWSIIAGALPTGLTLNNLSPAATITGTPTLAGTYNFTVQVSDSGANLGTRVLSIPVTGASQQLPALPQRWVNGRESLLASYTNVATINNSSTWSCHGSAKGPYAVSLAGLDAAIVDTEACRAANGDSAKIVIPHGTLFSQAFSTSTYLKLKQTGGDASTAPINITSDAPLPTNDPLTGNPRDQRVGTYNIASASGLSRVSTVPPAQEYKRPTADVNNPTSSQCQGGTNQTSPNFSSVYTGKSGVGPTGNNVSDSQISPASSGSNWNSRIFQTWQSTTFAYSQLSLNVSLSCSATAGSCAAEYSTDNGSTWTLLHSGPTSSKTTYTADITGATLSSVKVRACVQAAFTTVQTTSTLTLYDIWTSGTPIAKTNVTVNSMNTFIVPPAVGDLATIWLPDDKSFQGQYTVCGPPLCSAPTTSSFQYLQPSDLLNWMSASIANRTSVHLTGTGNPHYSWMDYDGQKFWFIKASTGHPWDINTYTQQFISHLITEDGDSADQSTCIANGFSSCFIDPFAYKRFLVPNPVMPRFLVVGQTFVIDSPGNNTYVRTTNCEIAGTSTNLNLGPTHAVTFFTTGDALNGGAGFGIFGIQQTLENDYYYGLSGGVYLDREVFQYLYGIGLVQWTFQRWDGTQYVNQQVTTDTTTTIGGAPTPSFPCYSNILANWIGGTPGAVGNASIPAADPTDAVSQNGIVQSFQAQSPISSISVAGCTTTGVIGAACTITIDFASDPGFSVNDRFDIKDSVCQGCITADPNTLNTTWYVATVTTNSSCSTCRITVFSYTEYVGNGATASPPGVALHFNHILPDQVACCMYTLEETSGTVPIIFGDTNNYHNYVISNAEIRSQLGSTHNVPQLVFFAPNGFSLSPIPAMSVAGCNGLPAQTNCDEPIHVGIDRSYLHGYSFPQVTNVSDLITVGIQLDCSYCFITNSYISDIHQNGSESHAIHVHAGEGPFKIADNYIEGTTENIFSSYLPPIVGLPTGWYCDWEIRRNWITSNLFEMLNADAKIPNGTTSYFTYLPKNKIEFKNICNAIIDGNIIENSSGGPGEQQGTLQGNNSETNNGVTNNPQPGSNSHDVTYSDNIYRHAYNGGYFASRAIEGDTTNLPTHHYAWLNNLFYDIGNVTLYGKNAWTGTSWSLAIADLIKIANRGQTYPCTASSATVGGVTTATLSCSNPTPCVPYVGQTICGTGIQAGDWVNVSNCSDANYNVIAPRQVPSLTSDPNFNTLTVQYLVSSAAGPSATGCSLVNGYGWPRYTTFQHNTSVMNYNITNPVYQNKYPQNQHMFGCEGGGPLVMTRDWWMQNNVFSMQWPVGVVGSNARYFFSAPNVKEGTLAEQTCWDSNSLVWTNNAVVGNTKTLYTEYNCPAGVCGANNGVSPPVTDLMGLTNACAGTPDNTCIGFLGNYVPQTFGRLGGTANPANVPDFAPAGFGFDLFSLSPSSYFFAGHAGQANDGSNNAIDLNALYNALGAQIYTCSRACGGGPFN